MDALHRMCNFMSFFLRGVMGGGRGMRAESGRGLVDIEGGAGARVRDGVTL